MGVSSVVIRIIFSVLDDLCLLLDIDGPVDAKKGAVAATDGARLRRTVISIMSTCTAAGLHLPRLAPTAMPLRLLENMFGTIGE